MGKLGEGTGSQYPSNIDESLDASGKPVDGNHPNDLMDAVIKIESELGLDPKAGYTNLGERIQKLIQDFYIPKETPNGLINGTNKQYTTDNAYVAGSIKVFLNGILEDNVTEIDDTTFDFNTYAPQTGDSLKVEYVKKP